MTTDATDLELRAQRVLPATPDEVFDAYTDAEKPRTWVAILHPEPGSVEFVVDGGVGGQPTAVWGPSRDELFRETQTFLEIDRPHRLVTDSVGSSPDGATMATRVVVTFEAVDGGTLMSVVQSGFPTPEIRDFFAAHAWVGAFDRIGAYLARA
jgi:uncharacterized protein YndB with AHSA1/START domain